MDLFAGYSGIFIASLVLFLRDSCRDLEQTSGYRGSFWRASEMSQIVIDVQVISWV